MSAAGDRDPQSRQAARNARAVGALSASTPYRRANWDLREPEETGTTFRDNARIKAEAAAKAARSAGLCRRFRPCGRRARRRARHPFGALGRPRQGFRPRHGRGRSEAWRARRHHAGSSARRISSRRCASPGRMAMSRNSRAASTARWSGRRAATRASATIRCSCRTATSRTFGEMTSEEKHGLPPRGRACRTAPAPSSSSRRRVLALR